MLYFDNAKLGKSEEAILHEKLNSEGQNLLISCKNHRFYGKKELIFKNESLIIFGQIQAKKSIQDEVLKTIANNFSKTNFDFLNEIDLGYNLIILLIFSDEIFAIRDYFGIKPLYFSGLNGVNCVSNSIQKIRNIKKKSFEPNDKEIKNYLSNSYDDSAIESSTFFKGIERVQPGQLIHFTLNNIQKHQTHQNYFKSQIEENSISKFRNALERQISLIGEESRIVCHLSGGLDSSSLAGLLNNDPKAIYYNTGLKSTNEFNYAKIAAKQYGLEIAEVSPKNDALHKIKTTTRLTAQPECLVIPSFIFYDIFELSKQLGCENIVSGHGGDAIVGSGYEYFEILFDLNKKSELEEAFKNYNRFKNHFTYDDYILGKLKQQVSEFSILKALKTLLRFRPKSSFILKSIVKRIKRPIFRFQKTLMFKDLKIKKAKRFIANKDLNVYQTQHLNTNFVCLSNHALEISDVIAEHFESQTYYPFLSKNLLKVAINTPHELNFDFGQGRGLLRNAIKDVLPKEILNRTDKTSFSEFEYQIFKILWLQHGQFLNSNHKVWNYVKRNVYLKEVTAILKQEYKYQQFKNKTHQCCRILYLSIWLEQEF